MTKLQPVLHAPTGGLRLKSRGAAINSLSVAEREVILTIGDDEQAWHVFTDSRRALSTRLLRVAQALGVPVERVGAGYQLDLPLNAVSFRVAKPPTEAQVRARARSLQKALRFGRSERQNAPPVRLQPREEALDGPEIDEDQSEHARQR